MKTQTFYFDESGFTGNNLLDPEQQYFVYAGVAISEDNALKIHSEAIRRFQINARELKGSNLIKHHRGRDAVSWVLEQSRQHSHVLVADKEYALSGKFFEYVFEPVLSSHSSLFYAIGFHKYIATLLYVCIRAADPHVSHTIRNFSDMVRSLDPGQLEVALSPLNHFDQSNPIGMIYTFAICHQKRIENEILSLRKAGSVASWPLELSMTALHWLLASWGEEFEVLDAYCDESKPIRDSRDFFDVFIGRKDRAYLRIGDQRTPSFIYNLSGPIKLVDSEKSSGVQIADVISSSLAYALKNRDEEISRAWLKVAEDMHTETISTDGLTQEGAYLNSIILRSLVDRTVKGQDLFENMSETISLAMSHYPEYSREMSLDPVIWSGGSDRDWMEDGSCSQEFGSRPE